MRKHIYVKMLIILVMLIGFSARFLWAESSESHMITGLARTVSSVFEIPKTIVRHSQTVVFPVSIVTGTVEGAFRTVGGVLGGVVETASGALPYAKYAALFA
ncbi:MAG: hypothetical protein H6757_01260 [Candidatus Omnitrophica bacterium]|nr:hypothetical protein [Candidatus Omnitrophota bacterium]